MPQCSAGTTAGLDPGAQWLVLGGTVNAGTQWRMSTTGAITPGTTAIATLAGASQQAAHWASGLTEASAKALQGALQVSLNDHPGVREVFAGFTIEAVETTYSVFGGAQRAGEVLISR